MTSRLWLLVVAAGCFPRFDLDEPIVLVPGTSVSERQVELVASAAACWKLGFAVPFVVDPHSVQPQQISIDLNEAACNGRLGQYSPGMPAEIVLCPHAYAYHPGPVDDVRLLQIVLHELGHASGIDAHSTSAASVMGQATSVYAGSSNPVFSVEDGALFGDSNGRSGEALCEVRLFATSSWDVPHCQCVERCSPDRLEPNDEWEPALLDADAILSLCVGDRDAFTILENRRIEIASTDPDLVVITRTRSGLSESHPQTTQGTYVVDVVAGTNVSVQSNRSTRDYITDYRIRFVTP